MRLVEVTEDQHGQRVDNFLMSRLKGVPKSRIYRLLRKGEVRVNKGRVKPETRLSCGDTVRIPPVRMLGKASNLTALAWGCKNCCSKVWCTKTSGCW